LLDGVKLAIGSKALERGHLALDSARGQYARVHRGAIDQNRTGAALAEAATEVGALEIEIVAKDVEKRGRWFGVHGVRDTVDL
jgi:hypothetical protein